MRVAYVASRYPHISHTFILREVEALRAEGVEVDTFSVRHSESSGSFGPAERAAAASTTTIVPATIATLVRSQVAALRRGPRAYLATLLDTIRDAPPGVKGSVWAVLYFVEGVILWWHCQRRGIGHIHAHFANVGADVARAAARLGRGLEPGGWSWSFTMHGYTEFSDVTTFGLSSKIDDADLIVCISEYARTQVLMHATRPDAADRVHIVHCGIDVRQFQPGPARAEGPLRLLFLGRLVVEKGPVVLVEAVALLAASGVDVELTIVGDGPARPVIEQAAAELGVADRVLLAGATPPEEAPEWYRAADVFCLPSFAEGVPVVLMEAMASGLPVVTTYVTGIPELVVDGVHGLTVTPGRADRVADAVRSLDDPERRRVMGEAGREKVSSEFDISTVGPQLAAVFAAL